MTAAQPQRDPEPRFVRVTFAVPGLAGSQSEVYDRLSLSDMTAWLANTIPPAMQFSAIPLPDMGMIATAEEFASLQEIQVKSREAARNARRART